MTSRHLHLHLHWHKDVTVSATVDPEPDRDVADVELADDDGSGSDFAELPDVAPICGYIGPSDTVGGMESWPPVAWAGWKHGGES